MEAIVDLFLEFLKNNASQFGNTAVNISSLQEQAMNYTPIALSYSDPATAFTDMAGVAIMNFCKYCDDRKYPMNGLNSIKRIITKSINDEDTKIQLMLLIHITKMKLPINKSVYLYASIAVMTMDVEMTDQLTIWKNLALKVLEHSMLYLVNLQVNETINRLMEDTFGMAYSQRIAETEQTDVSVEFVDTNALELRGFAGINCVYINEQHFKMRLLQLSQIPVEKENALQIDIATVVIHEYSHVRIRQVLDDLNMSTPTSIASSASVSDPDFGRIAERAFFKVAIDWPKSLKFEGVPSTYIESFLRWIKNNSTLPVPLESPNLVERDSRTVMCGGGVGADLCFLDELQ